MTALVSALRENPELAISLTLALGSSLGRLRVGSFKLGNVVGTLLAGVIVSQLVIEIDPITRIVFFDLFLFATGYKVDPQFFRGLKRSALKEQLLTLVLCISSLLTTFVVAKLLALRLTGVREEVERAGRALGYLDRKSDESDVVFVGLGIFIGGLIGLLTLTVAELPLSLTASGGALVMGLVFGWLRSVRPTFGRIPEPALWVFDTIGLTTFIGIVGLTAGPNFVIAGPRLHRPLRARQHPADGVGPSSSGY